MTRQEAIETIEILKAHGGNKSAAARALGIPRPTFQSRVERAKSFDLSEPVNEVESLKDRIYQLETALKSARSETLDDQYVKRKIIGLSEAEPTIPSWTVRRTPSKGAPGVPATVWSDWHWGEVVEKAQVGGVNEFNLQVAHERARTLVEKTIDLLRNHVVNPKYPGIVVNLGGDMVSGDIHDELSETNEAPIMPVVLDLYGVLLWAIRTIADEFGNVFVPCVTGNHGRNTKKPRAKGRNYTNFDWLLYNFLAKAFEGDQRIAFYVPDGPDALYRIYGTRYLLTHGDQFRGGDSQIGAIGPLTRGNKRKLARNTAINLEYDVMLCGHWHQYMPLPRQIVNGSLCGYNEYANSMNFDYEPPTQALWITHPEHGPTIHMPVFLDRHARLQESGDWVSVKSKS